MRGALFFTWAPAPQNVCARPSAYYTFRRDAVQMLQHVVQSSASKITYSLVETNILQHKKTPAHVEVKVNWFSREWKQEIQSMTKPTFRCLFTQMTKHLHTQRYDFKWIAAYTHTLYIPVKVFFKSWLSPPSLATVSAHDDTVGCVRWSLQWAGRQAAALCGWFLVC